MPTRRLIFSYVGTVAGLEKALSDWIVEQYMLKAHTLAHQALSEALNTK